MSQNVRWIALVLLLNITAAARAQDYSSTFKGYRLERWDDDYTYLRYPGAVHDVFDPIKYMPLNRAGDVYVSFGGQARYRYDYFNNRNFGQSRNDDEDGFHLQRYLLHADVHVGEHVRTFVQLDSSFIDGREDGGRYGDSQHLDFQQGFVDIKTSDDANPFAYLRLGRQELVYGAQRLISPDDWRNVRRSFDGAKVSVSIPNETLDLFVVRPVLIETNQFDNDDPGTVFSGVYNATALPDLIENAHSKLELYFLALNQTQSSIAGIDSDTYTLGCRFTTKPGAFDFDVEADWQFGDVSSTSLAAWSVATEAGYTLAGLACSPRASVGLDIASGSSDPGGRFNQLFPPTYTFLGHAYLFGRPNLIDAHVGLDFHLTDRLTLLTAQHVYWRQNTDDSIYNLSGGVVRADGGSNAAYIGNEFDIALTWQIDRHTSAYMGWAHLFAGTFLSETGASQDSDFLYASMTFTF